MPESVTVKFRYTPEEYARAVRLHHAGRTNFTLELAMVVLLIALGCWNVWENESSSWTGYTSLVVSVFWVAMLSYITLVAPKLAFRSNSKLAEEYELTFAPEGIHFRTPSIDSKLQWSHYSRALVNGDFFLLYYGEHFYSTIPKRVFANSEAIQTFENLLVRFVPNIKRRA